MGLVKNILKICVQLYFARHAFLELLFEIRVCYYLLSIVNKVLFLYSLVNKYFKRINKMIVWGKILFYMPWSAVQRIMDKNKYA